MHFPIASLASLLALISHISAQVVVTVTSTVTVVTVTYTPPTTSTSTVLVTVPGSPPPTLSTSTKTVTVTTGPPPPPPSNTCPIPEWGQCGGEGYSGSCTTCGDASVCKYKDVWYSYCSNLPKVETVVATVYSG